MNFIVIRIFWRFPFKNQLTKRNQLIQPMNTMLIESYFMNHQVFLKNLLDLTKFDFKITPNQRSEQFLTGLSLLICGMNSFFREKEQNDFHSSN